MLYHGSKIQGIKALKPFPHNGVDGEPVVFATPDIRFALAMIYGTGNELAVGYFVDQETGKEEMYIDELVPDALNLLSAPGVLYTLEDSGFSSDPRLSHSERISKSDAKVIAEKHIANILQELQKYEIKLANFEEVLDEMRKRGKEPQNAAIQHKSDRFG